MESPGKIRVAVVIPRYHPVFGGAENQCRTLNRFLLVTGRVQIPWILTKRIEPALAPVDRVDGIEVRRLGFSGVNRWSEYAFYLHALAWLVLARGRYDVIHCHASALIGFVMMVAGKCAGRPVILKLSSGGELLNTSSRQHASKVTAWTRLVSRVKVGLARWTASSVYFVALNQEGIDELSCISPARPSLIPNGVELTVFSPASRERRLALRREFRMREEDFVISFTGRFVKGKGIDVLLVALSQLLEEQPSLRSRLRLCLVGSGHLQDGSVSDLIDGVASRFPGNLRYFDPRNPPIEFLQMSDAFVFPSRREGMPNSVLEAFGVGLRCILSDIRPHCELAKQNPQARTLLFRSGDSASLAQALASICLESGRDRTAESVLDPRFDIQRVARMYVQLYEQAAGNA